MNEFERQPWIDDARALLDESTQALDAASLSRLNRARQAALAQQQQRRKRKRITWGLPAAGVACSAALLLAVAVWAPQRAPGPGIAPAQHTTAALPGEAEDDGIEFYQNLEFYAWLDAQDQETGG
jgi:hypothetical protein